MTWPEYLAGCCRLDGRLTRLSYQEADVLLALLLCHPDRPSPTSQIIEQVWTNPSTEPTNAADGLKVVIYRLRRRGIPIEGRKMFGYRIPRHARGRQRRLPLAA